MSEHGIDDCYFKSISQKCGDIGGTRKRHSHTGFEFHIMLSGSQTYETERSKFVLDGGKILAVPKGIPHSLSASSYPIEKFAFTFSLDDGRFEYDGLNDCVLFEIPERVLSNIHSMTELHKSFDSQKVLLENSVFETVLLLLKEVGIAQLPTVEQDKLPIRNNGDQRVELARRFILDNIEEPICVGEVAAYCYISEKQLNRLFSADIGMTVTEYIRRERVRRIEELLSNTNLAITQISDRMRFPDEHGFNIFFKKYNGMPPGAYRKMTQNGKE